MNEFHRLIWRIKMYFSKEKFWYKGYMALYPECGKSKYDLFRHYIRHGKSEGRSNGLVPPIEMFFAEGYRTIYPDIAEAGIDPWHHYVLNGKAEGRCNGLVPPSDIFFAEGYREIYSDIAESGVDPWQHYVMNGKAKGRCNGLVPPSDIFFAEGYRAIYPDIAKSGIDPWHHYVLSGKAEGRCNGHIRGFDDIYYRNKYNNIDYSVISPEMHYNKYGARNGFYISFEDERQKNPPQTTVNIDKCYDKALGINLKLIKKIINQDTIRVVSFAIFDTLLCRPAIDQKDIFYLIAQRVKEEFGIDFIEIRENIELKSPSTSIDDIYDEIRKVFDIPYDILDKIKEIELSTEKQLLFRRQEIFEIYDFAIAHGKRVIAVSDMYLPSTFLETCLRKEGYTSISKIYVSCEYAKRKDYGELYDKILYDEGLKPDELFHIGDNSYSDFSIPLKKGISSYKIPSMKDSLFSQDTIWKELNNSIQDPFIRIIFGFLINKYSKYLIGRKTAAMFDNLEAFSSVAIGLVLITMELMILNNEQIQKNYKKLYFASRDGYLPYRAYNIIRRQDNINALYFASGRLLYYPIQKNNFEEFIRPDKSVDQSMTLEHFILSFIHDKKLCNDILSQVSAENRLIEIRDADQIHKILIPFKSIIDAYIESSSNQTIKYYRSIFTEQQNIVFDCGYSGSISKALSNATGKKIDKIYMFETEENVKFDLKYKTNTFCLFGGLSNIFSSHIMFEEIFSPLAGRPESIRENFEQNYTSEEHSMDMQRDMSIIHTQALDAVSSFSMHFMYLTKYFKIENPCDSLNPIMHSFTKSIYSEHSLLKNILFEDIAIKVQKNLTQKIEDGRIFYDNKLLGVGIINPKYYVSDEEYPRVETSLKIGIHIHIHNSQLFYDVVDYLANLPKGTTVLFTSSNNYLLNLVQKIVPEILSDMTISTVHVPNRGRNVAPWMIETGIFKNFDLCLHMHEKQSKYTADKGESWRKYLFKSLLSKRNLISIFNIFTNNKKLGVLAPKPFADILNAFRGGIPVEGNTSELLSELCQRIYSKKINISRDDYLFSVGMMFWYRPTALFPLTNGKFSYKDFPQEPIGIDGTLAHTVERAIGLVCRTQGYELKLL